MSSAKAKVLDTAEMLFHQNGYGSVSMRDIASALDMKKGSLYYHAPGGKEQLYVEVTERMFHRHHIGLTAAISAGENIEDALYRVARWLFSQPPMYLFKVMEGDMVLLTAENAAILERRADQLLFQPLVRLFEGAIDNGEIRPMPAGMLTGMFLTLIEGVGFAHRSPSGVNIPLDEMIDDALDLMIYGIKPRLSV